MVVVVFLMPGQGVALRSLEFPGQVACAVVLCPRSREPSKTTLHLTAGVFSPLSQPGITPGLRCPPHLLPRALPVQEALGRCARALARWLA